MNPDLLSATLCYCGLSGIRMLKPEITYNTSRVSKTGRKLPDGIEIRFGENIRPSASVREELKRYGFSFSERQKIWYAQDDAKSRAFIEIFGDSELEVDDTVYEKKHFWALVNSMEEYKRFFPRTEFNTRRNGMEFFNSKWELEKKHNVAELINSRALYFKKFYNQAVQEYPTEGQPEQEQNENRNPEPQEENDQPENSNTKPTSSSVRIAEKLRDLADGMQKAINEKLHPASERQNPTPRRARIIASMKEDGYKMLELQNFLYALANVHEKGISSWYGPLANITNKSQADDLLTIHKNASDESLERYRQRDSIVKIGITSVSELKEARQKVNQLLDDYRDANPESKPDEQGKEIEQKIRELIGAKIPGFFPTPEDAIKKLLEGFTIDSTKRILEPSAGKGDIADYIRNIAPEATLEVCEINFRLREILEMKGHKVVASDFMEYNGNTYDLIVMNPPFEKSQDIDHVFHAFDLLKPGGKIIAIMSEGPFFRSGRKENNFRLWLKNMGAKISEPIKNAFKSSFNPTGVTVRFVAIYKKKENVSRQTTPPQEDLSLLELEAMAEIEILQLEEEERLRKQNTGVAGLEGSTEWKKDQAWKVLDFH
jgi:hypothetical protein